MEKPHTSSSQRTQAFSNVLGSSQKFLRRLQRPIAMLHMNLELPTLLMIGMFMQTLVFMILPPFVAACPAVIFLVYKMLHANPKTLADNLNLRGARMGRWSASVPNDDGTLPQKAGGKGVVCFAIGSQANHPLGIFAPGFKKVGDYFERSFVEAEKDPDKWGLLSRTPNFYSQGPGRGNYTLTLSYWKSLDHLHNFAAHSLHAEARQWWNRTKSQWPHIGIWHETYVCPPGHYETIYENMHPFGMGQMGQRGDGSGKTVGLAKADGPAFRSMHARMGKEI